MIMSSHHHHSYNRRSDQINRFKEKILTSKPLNELGSLVATRLMEFDFVDEEDQPNSGPFEKNGKKCSTKKSVKSKPSASPKEYTSKQKCTVTNSTANRESPKESSKSSKKKLPSSKRKVNALFEEDIVDGFAILTFFSYADLEVSMFQPRLPQLFPHFRGISLSVGLSQLADETPTEPIVCTTQSILSDHLNYDEILHLRYNQSELIISDVPPIISIIWSRVVDFLALHFDLLWDPIDSTWALVDAIVFIVFSSLSSVFSLICKLSSIISSHLLVFIITTIIISVLKMWAQICLVKSITQKGLSLIASIGLAIAVLALSAAD